MKQISTTILLLCLFLATSAQYAEPRPSPVDEYTAGGNLSSSVTGFTTTYNAGKLYFNIKILNEQRSSFLMLEKSQNNKDYKVVEIKEVAPNSINIPISYYFVDKQLSEGSSQYRIVQVFASETQEIAQYIHNEDKAVKLAEGID